MAGRISNKDHCEQAYNTKSPDIQDFFSELPNLLATSTLDVALLYMFSRTETAHRHVLHLGLVRGLKVKNTVAWECVAEINLKRAEYYKYFEKIFGIQIDGTTKQLLYDAAETRDRIIHGKSVVGQTAIRTAIINLLEYAEETNTAVQTVIRNIHPFRASRRGLLAQQKTMPENPSRWVARGLGFDVTTRFGF